MSSASTTVRPIASADSELKLVNGVELKLALASDGQFEKLIQLYLCPVLLKLDSPHRTTREKTVAVLSMIDNRLTGGEMKLPYESLLKQYHEPTVGEACKTLVVRYLSDALKYAPKDDSTLSNLTRGFSRASTIQQSRVFHMVCRLLAEIQPPSDAEGESRYVEQNRIDSLDDQTALYKRFIDLMFLNLGYFAESRVRAERGLPGPANSMRQQEAATQQANRKRLAMSGLTVEEIQFLTPAGADTYTIASLNQVKCGLMRFIAMPVMLSCWRYTTALVGAFDLNNETQNLATGAMRKCETPDDSNYARSLYTLLLSQSHTLHQLQIKLYQLLSKSTAAVNDTENAMKSISYGVKSENTKVRSASIGFLQWFARFAPVADHSSTTPLLLSQLTNFLAKTEASDDAKSSAYVAMGLLCKRDAAFAQENVEIVQFLFTALSTETTLRPAVDEALSTLIYAYRSASREALSNLQAVLLDVIVNKPMHTHYTALRFCLAVYEFSDAGARWMCILATSKGHSPETIQEARKGLSMYHFQLLQPGSENTTAFPSLAHLIHWSMQNLVHGTYMELSNITELDKSVLDTFIDFARSAMYADALAAHQNVPKVSDEAFEQNLHDVVTRDLKVREILQAYHGHEQVNHEKQEALDKFQKILVQTFFLNESISAGTSLLELLILYPEPLTSSITRYLSRLREMLKSPTKKIHDLSTQIYAIVGSSVSNADHELHLELVRLRQDSELQGLAGAEAISLLSKLLLRLQWRAREYGIDLATFEPDLLTNLQSKDPKLVRLSLDALGNFALTSYLTDRSRYVPALSQLIKNKHKATEAHLVERACIVLGYISCGLEVNSENLNDILDLLITENAEALKIDLLLAIGEALACCIGRDQSAALRGIIDVPLVSLQPHLSSARGDLATTVVERLLNLTVSPRPLERKGACIRLISLVQLLNMNEINSRFSLIHSAFLSLLSDKDDFIVQSANKGIQVVFEKSDQKQKDELIAQLFSTMTSDSAARQTGNPTGLSADSELFTPGTMSIGTGEKETSLSTYKDICNLALDAGNNSLIYSFLSLVSSSSMWSTRRGAALGLNSLLASTASADIAAKSPDMLRRLLPKLYRYKHDPSTKVASAMNDIFQQLFPNSKNTLDAEFSLVLSELLKCLSDSQWRTRESAATALTNLLSGRSASQFREHMEEIWTLGFRVLDDVKESVRTAAIGLCKSLANIAIKSAGSDHAMGTAQGSILESAIPLFIKHLKSPSIEVSSFSLETLLKVTKAAGKSVRPHLSVLIEEYLVLTSTMEPEVMNYLGFHASKYNLSQNDLDNHRLASMRTSPLIEALEQCVDQLDSETAETTLPRICQIIRQTNGLPTRAAISRFLISLTSRNPTLMQRHADSVLQALSTTLQDRNETVVALSSSAVGYLARVATAEKLVKLMDFLSKKQFESDEHKTAQGLVLKAISQNANDRFNSMGDAFLPICFFAMHDTDQKAALNYKQTWEHNTGSNSAVKLYLDEILSLVEKYLTSPMWRVKQMSATTLATIATTVNLGSSTDRVLDLVVHALDGKSWPGKESILKAFVALLQRSRDLLSPLRMIQFRSIMAREAKRTNVKYQRHALVHYAAFLDLDQSNDAFSQVAELTGGILSTDAMDIDQPSDASDDDNGIAKPTTTTTRPEKESSEDDGLSGNVILRRNAIRCLMSSYHVPNTENYVFLIRTISKNLDVLPWQVHRQLTSSLSLFFTRLSSPSTQNHTDSSVPDLGNSGNARDGSGVYSTTLVSETWTLLLLRFLRDRNHQSLRESSAFATVKFMDLIRHAASFEVVEQVKRGVQTVMEGEESSIVLGILRKVI